MLTRRLRIMRGLLLVSWWLQSSALVSIGTSPRRGLQLFAAADRDALRAMKVRELREALGERGLPWASYLEKEDLVNALYKAMVAEDDFCASGAMRPGVVAELTGEQLEVEIQDDSTPLLVDVYARWCGPCQLMAPELVQAAKRLGPAARVGKLDSDLFPELSSKLHIGGLPTVLLFDRGHEVRRIEGAVMSDSLVDLVTSHAA